MQKLLDKLSAVMVSDVLVGLAAVGRTLDCRAGGQCIRHNNYKEK